ncbi:MAG: hypothetical protein LUG66_04570 [Clostridiales bacterium]|nr:hypothetical protein [Clostridiales bacterium]
MSDVERIINNVNASMEMENMPLIAEDKDLIKSCLEGKISFGDTLNDIVSKYTKESFTD